MARATLFFRMVFPSPPELFDIIIITTVTYRFFDRGGRFRNRRFVGLGKLFFDLVKGKFDPYCVGLLHHLLAPDLLNGNKMTFCFNSVGKSVSNVVGNKYLEKRSKR